tara:strand:+ start:392 stop:850 length:459 start_codon:yes stop_codon:yes gene_type:complete
MLAIIQISFLSLAQTNAHLPLKSFSFDFVSVNVFDDTDSTFNESGQFTGDGEIQIYNDSITVTWTNQWECGTYRLFIDTANYQKMEYEDRLEWLSVYKVRSKGYHLVDGWLTLVEGSNIKDGSYTHIIYDTNFTSEGWARKRRFYPDLVELK